MKDNTEITEADMADHAAFLSSWADDIDRNAGGHSVDAARLRRIAAALQASTSPPAEPGAGVVAENERLRKALREVRLWIGGPVGSEREAEEALSVMADIDAALTKGSPNHAG